MNGKFIQVNTTTDSESSAEKIADTVTGLKLAACAQIVGPVISYYCWKGKREKAAEWLVMMKTRDSLFTEIEKAILSVHPYELPEIIALPILFAGDRYSEWMLSNIN